jgi:lipopolysaccharide transport system permease protein
MSTTASRTELVIEAGRSPLHYWRDVWAYRELLLFLAWRDILVRYKQTVIGAAWAVIRPLLSVLVFTVVFSVIARLPSEGRVPYALLVLTGMLPWQFFATGLADAASSLVLNERIVSKVYFPRVIVPVASSMVSLVDFLVSVLLLAALFGWYAFTPDWRILALPLVLIAAAAVVLGPGLLLSALNVKYRDFRYVVPFLLQVAVYISPVGYSTSLVPEVWRTWYYLNPMAGIIDAFRWCLLAGEFEPHWRGVAVSLAITLALLVAGVRYFRTTERAFADII